VNSEGTRTNIGPDIFGELKIPRRSKFYHLKPMGIGTPFVESLSGFAARLAQEHSVTPNALLKEAIPLASTLRMMPINFSCFHRAINGSGVIALSFIKALEALTMRQDLSWTTMITWMNVLPHYSLIRAKRGWCSVCYETWRETSGDIYDPLLWTLEAIAVCPLHKTFLTTSCPNCEAHLLHFASRSRPGFCYHCKGWLGLSSNAVSSKMLLRSGEDMSWQLWKAETIGTLLANASTVKVPTREEVARSLRYCIDNFSWGRVSRFASQFEVPSKRVQGWLNCERIPVLETLLKLTYKMNIPLLTFLCGSFEKEGNTTKKSGEAKPRSGYKLTHDEVRKLLEGAVSSGPPEPLQEFVRFTGWSRGKLENHFPKLCETILNRHAKMFYKPIDKVKVLPVLRSALREKPPPSMVEVARRVGCNAVSLRDRFPDLTTEIVSRYKHYRHTTDWQRVEAHLKESLSKDPPYSMNKTARCIGISPRNLRSRFSELCQAISRRFEEWNIARMKVRKEQLYREVTESVLVLVSEGVYPSIKRVAARTKVSRNTFEIRIILSDVKRELSNNAVYDRSAIKNESLCLAGEL
jgi:AraC-like DNA-binding protein